MGSQSVSHPPTGWPQDHGPTNVGAMVKTGSGEVEETGAGAEKVVESEEGEVEEATN